MYSYVVVIVYFLTCYLSCLVYFDLDEFLSVLRIRILDPQDYGFLDPDPQKSTDPDPRGNMSTKKSKKIFFTPNPQIWTFEEEKRL